MTERANARANNFAYVIGKVTVARCGGTPRFDIVELESKTTDRSVRDPYAFR
jgi:hypothetical protein